jgi:hypothetical protein
VLVVPREMVLEGKIIIEEAALGRPVFGCKNKHILYTYSIAKKLLVNVFGATK